MPYEGVHSAMFRLLPLPASPPYRLQGRLVLKGKQYTIDDLSGKIGSTDVHGKAGYLNREPRPLLTAALQSNLLNIDDLGQLVGVQTKQSGGKPAITQAPNQHQGQRQTKVEIGGPEPYASVRQF